MRRIYYKKTLSVSQLLDLIILLVSFSAILFCAPIAKAKESFEFNLGEKINILSDKAFRKSKENEFEAVGNIVITHLKNSIYGDRAKINFTTGMTLIEGNVRYISSSATLYGSHLEYNFLSHEIHMVNARVVADSFSVVGKKIDQFDSENIMAEEAEYSTCKDCPESWSVYGSNIHITLGRYVRIKNAYIKINGVITMYFPYIVFPIKQIRETGLLFPVLSFKSGEGIKYQQPYYWVLGERNDLTLTPSVYGNRGLGGEFQYRQTLAEKTWFEFNTMGLGDGVYLPYKTSKEATGEKKYRQFSDLEMHSVYKQYVNGHFYLNNTSDLDTKRDFDYFVNDKTRGTEFGGGGFIDGRSSLFSANIQSYYNKNMLVDDPKKFDNSYVQILPKITLASVPYSLWNSDQSFFRNISVGQNADFTYFKQNRPVLTGPIRNAERLNFNPYVEWQLSNIGPIFISQNIKLDYQNYYLPYETKNWFQKSGLVYQTEARIELEKIYGLSYIEEIPPSVQDAVYDENKQLIGNLPKTVIHANGQKEMISNHSYRHAQEFKFIHYYLSDQTYKGNDKFYNQILVDDGQFDYVDALRSKEHLSNQITAEDSLPLSNTIEFQWNNNIIRKKSKKFDPYENGKYLKDNFDYSNIYYFNLSQGLDLSITNDQIGKSVTFFDRLTRLYVNTGLSLDDVSFNFQEYYFHRSGEHKLYTEALKKWGRTSVFAKFTFNSVHSSNTSLSKLLSLGTEFYFNDLITLKTSVDYDLMPSVRNRISQNNYAIIYSPQNNCWKMELNYAQNLIEKRVGFIFYINYNNQNYLSLNVH